MNRRHRLTGSRRFLAVRAWRAAAASGPVRVHAGRNTVGSARAGFAIPRSVGGAVVRNRLRRRLRALLAPRLDDLGGIDLVVVASPGAARLDSKGLGEHLLRCVDAAAARARRAEEPAERARRAGRGTPEGGDGRSGSAPS